MMFHKAIFFYPKWAFLSLLIILAFCANGQVSPQTQLYFKVKQGKLAESIKADSLFTILKAGLKLAEPNIDSLGSDFLKYAEVEENTSAQALAYLFLAYIDRENENSAQGITHVLKGIQLFDTIQQKKGLCAAYQLLAFFYGRTKNYELVAKPTLKALKIAEELQDNNLLFESYNGIGLNYIREKKFEDADKYYRMALVLAKKQSNLKQLAKIYTNIGIAFRNKQVWDSALFYHNMSLRYAQEAKDNYNIAFALNDIGVIYSRIDDYDKALTYLYQSAAMRERDGEKWELGFTYNFIAECLINQSKFAECENYCRKGIAISFLSNNIRQRYESYEIISILFQLQNRLDSAFYYLNLHANLRESFQRSQNNLATDAIIASYQFEEKEKEIKLLNETAANQKLKIQKQQLYLGSASLGLVLIIVIVVLIIRNRKQTTDKLWLEAKLKEEAFKREANERLQNEKERISRDLHDNVGGQLAYVLYSIDGFNTDNQVKRAALSQNINESIKQVIGNLRETIWAINDESILISDFSDKFKVYVRSMFRNSEVNINFKENIESNLPLNSLLGLNLYRICQEIINNAFKYAQASEIDIQITAKENIKVEISDNGIGIDLASLSTVGFGLTNIKTRSQETGISLTLTSKPNEGVKYTLLI
ncbi:MAG: tetratricopeptide repeat protein [Bacteroidota bacterium]|nr:tetratricopeptide repeat protein [Bacteroidota bacterium]